MEYISEEDREEMGLSSRMEKLDKFNYHGKSYQIKGDHIDPTTEVIYWLARNRYEYNDMVLLKKTKEEL